MMSVTAWRRECRGAVVLGARGFQGHRLFGELDACSRSGVRLCGRAIRSHLGEIAIRQGGGIALVIVGRLGGGAAGLGGELVKAARSCLSRATSRERARRRPGKRRSRWRAYECDSSIKSETATAVAPREVDCTAMRRFRSRRARGGRKEWDEPAGQQVSMGMPHGRQSCRRSSRGRAFVGGDELHQRIDQREDRIRLARRKTA